MFEKERILVTGGTGFLGQHLIKLLSDSGYKVRTLNRSKNNYFDSLGVESFTGSVTNPIDLKKALRDCQAVFHLAGIVSRNPKRIQDMYNLHVEGTRSLIELSAEKGVKRIVYTSTSGAIACSRSPEQIADENSPYPIEITANWPYYASKIEAEKTAFSTAEKTGIDLIIINPSLLLGPGDERLASTVDVLKLMRGQIPSIPSGGLNFADVRDVAAGAINSLEKGKPGERYLLGGSNWTLEKFFNRIGELANIKVPKLKVPDSIALLTANTITPVYRFFGKRTPLDPISVQMSIVYWYADSSKANRELDYITRDPDETLRDTIEDLKVRFKL
jgi:dihydroflavonol-4-reductase